MDIFEAFENARDLFKEDYRKVYRFPWIKDIFREWTSLLRTASKQTELLLRYAYNLPSIPEDLLTRSEKIYREVGKDMGIDIHDMKLNLLKGAPLASHISMDRLRDIRNFEGEFIKAGCVLATDAYVFRGIMVPSFEALRLDVETVTFAAWDPSKAIQYFNTPAATQTGEDWVSVLMIIHLLKNTPIMRTSVVDEIVLPYDYSLERENANEPYMMMVAGCGIEGKPIKTIPDLIGKPGYVINYVCLPTARSRISTIKRYGTGVRSQGLSSVKKRMTTVKSKTMRRATLPPV